MDRLVAAFMVMTTFELGGTGTIPFRPPPVNWANLAGQVKGGIA
jgi:hypothetical protein